MSDNGSLPANPFTQKPEYQYQEAGLTKREHFASMAMQGLLSKNMLSVSFEETAEIAVKYADTLLYQLGKEG